MNKFFLFFIFVFIQFICHSQEIKFIGSLSKKKVSINEPFQLTYTINLKANGFVGPDLSSFRIFNGPNQSFSYSSSNGSITERLTYSYTLIGVKAGKYKINPASIGIGNGKLKSNYLEVEVTNNSYNASGNNNLNDESQKSGQNKSNQNVFINAYLSKTNVFIGEPVSLTYKVFSKYPLSSFSDLVIPSFNGFYSEEIQMDKQYQTSNENVNGVSYFTFELKKYILIPQKSGKLEIPSIESTIQVKEKSVPKDIFEQLFGGGYRDVQVKTKSKEQSIVVNPLPTSGKPENFNGAVGNYEYSISPDKKNLLTGEAFNLKILIKGKGNIKLIENPDLKIPEELELYSPQTKDNININSSGMSGSRLFEYMIIPRAVGLFKLENLSFSFFDPAKKIYETISIPPIEIDVQKGSEEENIPNKKLNQINKNNITGDIRLNNKPNTIFVNIRDGNFYFNSPYFILIGLIPFFILFGFLLIRKFKRTQILNKNKQHQKEAFNHAAKRIKSAEKFIVSGNEEHFIDEISKAIEEYIFNKFGLNPSEITADKIGYLFTERNIERETSEDFFILMESCQQAKFGKFFNTESRDLMNESIRVLSEIEKKITAG